MATIPSLSEYEFNLFQELLVKESGLYFDQDKINSLSACFWERMQEQGIDSYAEYYELLKFSPEGRLEISELFTLITIPETHFFRNPSQFEALMKFVLPETVARNTPASRPPAGEAGPGREYGKPSLRLWSAGCSKGDEAYSIAIAVMEALPDYADWDISILASDINKNILLLAKEGIYKEKDITYLPREYLGKYFVQKGKDYILSNKVKGLVKFRQHNLVKDSFSDEELQDLDIIFCRNVIMYFGLATIKQVVNNFYNCLKNEGYLFLGHAETLWQITEKLKPVELPKAFIYQKALYPVGKEINKPFMAVPQIKVEEFSDTKAPDKSQVHADFQRAVSLADEAKYKEAAEALKKIIEVDNLHIEAYYLLGVLAYKLGDLKEAEAQFRKVLYIDPGVAIIHFNLANLYLYQKKFDHAARELNNAIKLLGNRPKDEPVRFCEDFTVEFLLRICENLLTQFNPKG